MKRLASLMHNDFELAKEVKVKMTRARTFLVICIHISTGRAYLLFSQHRPSVRNRCDTLVLMNCGAELVSNLK